MTRSATTCMRGIACALTLTAGGIAQANDASKLIRDLGLVEADTPVRESAGWRAPTRIVVRRVDADFMERLSSAVPNVTLIAVDTLGEAVREARNADAVLGYCSPQVIAAGKRLRWVQTYYAGVESCASIPDLRERGILVTNMQRVAGPVMAEHSIALLLALSRGLQLYIPAQAQGRWDPSLAADGRMRSISGKTLLVAGLGGVGEQVAQRAHALGMTVIATRASSKPAPPFVSYVGGPDELLTLARRADAVIAALPLTQETRGLFDARFFGALKRGAYFVNVGRGGSVVTPDLIAALRSGQVGGAGLDVTDPEPLPADHALWRAPNIIITPHVSAESDVGEAARWTILRENLRRYAAGERMLSVVDVERGY